MITIDLQSAYNHLLIAEDLRPYLGFQVGTRAFRYRVAVMGLSPVPYQWTQLMKAAVKDLRATGIRIVFLLDDFAIFAKPKLIEIHRDTVLQRLTSLGLTISKKSQLQPSTKDRISWHEHQFQGHDHFSTTSKNSRLSTGTPYSQQKTKNSDQRFSQSHRKITELQLRNDTSETTSSTPPSISSQNSGQLQETGQNG